MGVCLEEVGISLCPHLLGEGKVKAPKGGGGGGGGFWVEQKVM